MRDKANTENMFYRVETDLELALYEDRIDACANRVIPQRFMQYICKSQTGPVASYSIGFIFGFHRVSLLLPIISLVSFTLILVFAVGAERSAANLTLFPNNKGSNRVEQLQLYNCQRNRDSRSKP